LAKEAIRKNDRREEKSLGDGYYMAAPVNA
jgi:hypothetical protein